MAAADLRREALDHYATLLRAWNARNPHAFAAAFTAGGSAIGFDGSPMNGRDEILSTLRGIFDNHPTASYVAKVREVRELSPDAVLIRAVAGMAPAGTTDLNPAVNAVQSVVLVREGGVLRVALFQNTPAAFHGRPEQSARLTAELQQVLQKGTLLD